MNWGNTLAAYWPTLAGYWPSLVLYLLVTVWCWQMERRLRIIMSIVRLLQERQVEMVEQTLPLFEQMRGLILAQQNAKPPPPVTVPVSPPAAPHRPPSGYGISILGNGGGAKP